MNSTDAQINVEWMGQQWVDPSTALLNNMTKVNKNRY